MKTWLSGLVVGLALVATGAGQLAPGNFDAARPTAAYRLGAGDTVVMSGLRAEEISGKPLKVNEEGMLNLPPFGTVRVGGLPVREAEKAVAAKLAEYFNDPQITLAVAEFASQPVSVMGAVTKPGVYQLRGAHRLAEVISMAGGPRQDSGYRVTLTRRAAEGQIDLPGAKTNGDTFTADVSLTDIMNGANPAGNIEIRAHDLIAVPQARMVYVVGDVRKAGGFVLGEQENVSLLQALSLAEGLSPTAATANARILRQVGKSGRTEIPVDLRKILRGKASDMAMLENDILFVPGSTGKKAGLRVLDAATQIGTGVVIWRR